MKKYFLILAMLGIISTNALSQHTIEVKHKYYTMQYDTTQYAELIGYYIQTKAHTKEIVDRKTVAAFHQDPLIDPAYQVANDKEYSSWNAAHANKRRDKGHVNPKRLHRYSGRSETTITFLLSAASKNACIISLNVCIYPILQHCYFTFVLS